MGMIENHWTTAPATRGHWWGFGSWKVEEITQFQSLVALPENQPHDARVHVFQKEMGNCDIFCPLMIGNTLLFLITAWANILWLEGNQAPCCVWPAGLPVCGLNNKCREVKVGRRGGWRPCSSRTEGREWGFVPLWLQGHGVMEGGCVSVRRECWCCVNVCAIWWQLSETWSPCDLSWKREWCQ